LIGIRKKVKEAAMANFVLRPERVEREPQSPLEAQLTLIGKVVGLGSRPKTKRAVMVRLISLRPKEPLT